MSTKSMQAAQVVEYNKPYQLCERPVPNCGDDELLIEVRAAGFCHSDLQVLQGQFPAPLPMIASHEPAGVITQVGSNVGGTWKVGDRVGVLNFKKACGECVGCRHFARKGGRKDPRFCHSREMAGFKHDGAFAQFMIADPDTTVHLPKDVSFEQGAPLMCAGATAWGALQKLKPDVKSGETVGIVGIGGVGHLALQFAKAMGFRVVAIDNRPAGRQLATEATEQLKPDLVVDSSASDADDQILRFTSDEGLAGIVVCTDSIQANTWSLQQLGSRGVLVPLGLPKDKWQFNSDAIVFRELTIRGSYVAGADEVEDMFKVVGSFGVASHLTVVEFNEIPTIVDRYMEKSMKGRLVVRITH
ncbi:hypothetical protein NX059_000568 [Plenodomus lindquistii]|nr:hypothetical protein NX059_000568 [Plenodomus lindquistii]